MKGLITSEGFGRYAVVTEVEEPIFNNPVSSNIVNSRIGDNVTVYWSRSPVEEDGVYYLGELLVEPPVFWDELPRPMKAVVSRIAQGRGPDLLAALLNALYIPLVNRPLLTTFVNAVTYYYTGQIGINSCRMVRDGAMPMSNQELTAAMLRLLRSGDDVDAIATLNRASKEGNRVMRAIRLVALSDKLGDEAEEIVMNAAAEGDVPLLRDLQIKPWAAPWRY